MVPKIESTTKNRRNGVAFVIDKCPTKFVEDYEPINDRIIKITISSRPVKLHIIQVYMPTSAALDTVYTQIENIITEIPQKDLLIIMGDFNAKIGNTENDDNLRCIIGKFGLDTRNERGNRLLQFAIKNSFSITNTVFKHHYRRLSTWTSPTGEYKNQIDYVLIRTRWRSSVNNVRARPGAFCNSDHKLLKAEVTLKLHTTKKSKINPRLETTASSILQQTLRNLDPPFFTNNPYDLWTQTKSWILTGVQQCTTQHRPQKKKHWLRNNSVTDEKKKELDKRIKKTYKKVKNDYFDSICSEIEVHAINNQIHELYDKLKSVDVIKAYITRIREVNPTLNIISDERFKDALQDAEKADQFIESEKNSVKVLEDLYPYLGVPFTTKESMSVQGMLNTAGLYSSKGRRASKDSDTVVLMKKAGGIPLAVTNVPELTMWWETYNNVYGKSRNPYDPRRIVGGSSGGEGALLGAGGSVIGIGSDVGGSIRIPSFVNGIFGLKPSKGIVSNIGQVPDNGHLYDDFLSTGPMCRYATDLLPMLKVLADKNVSKLRLDRKVSYVFKRQ
ncbi:uncharacterized protein LOC111619366 [Centruroides sculpturatus]|uniref:uncharacterized protein LOC111619366 n=1 Tax=Centruroides sculpturatus TaxID=218467 RepID=UPI000C6EA405|nr:uncharacterized protein LOC111619366 [Centruroides sculpturatus]